MLLKPKRRRPASIEAAIAQLAPLVPLVRCVTEPPCKWEPGCWYCQKAKEKR